MHTIDLLKGQGIPQKTTLGSVFFTALVFVLPLLIGAWMIGMYATNKINLDVMERQVSQLKDSADEIEKLERELNNFKPEWIDIKKCVDTYIQWTPALISVVENMDDDMLIDSLVVTNDGSKGTSRNNTTDPNSISIPQRTMAAQFSLRDPNMIKLNRLMGDYKKKLDVKKELLSDLINLEYFQTPQNPDNSYTMNFIFKRKK
ncbi:MAG: hypothetical protein JXA96_05775 [Sedimentisphaerales bacterium]|nr:hypothetical protein [Sedimentisphaerales bacterium]